MSSRPARPRRLLAAHQSIIPWNGTCRAAAIDAGPGSTLIGKVSGRVAGGVGPGARTGVL